MLVKQLSLVCLMALSTITATARADVIYDISLIDLDGPQITGYVNATTNMFTVTTWIENAGGTATWSPLVTELPLHYTAWHESGVVYDVPDVWDGTIDLTWGFVSDLRNADISWNEGSYTEPNRHHGWGAGVSASTNRHVDFFTQTRWQWVPTGSTTVDTPNFDLVSVTLSEVPEPGSILAMLSLAGCGVGAVVARRRRAKKLAA